MLHELCAGVVLGIICAMSVCRGPRGVCQTMSWLLRLARMSLPKVSRRQFGAGSIFLVVPLAFAAPALVQASRILPSNIGLKWQAMAVMLLMCGFTHELGSLRHLLTCEDARKACFRGQHTSLLGLKAYPSKEDILAAKGMVAVYAIVLVTYALMFAFDIAWCHQDPVSGRPVSTLRFFEWTAVVPILLFISGHLHLQNPLEVVLPPILQTVAYIWLSWAAQLCHSTLLRALLVSACSTAVTESFLGMWKWTKASHRQESMLLLFTNIAFILYGIVYLLSLADAITTTTEEMLYTGFDVMVKLTFTGVMSSYARSKQIDSFYSTVKVYLDLMVGLRGLVGSQFDLLINCKISASGLLLIDANHTLEHFTGRALAGRHLEDICVSEADRTRLRQLSLNGRERSGVGQHASPWQRQEATYRMPNLICIDMISATSPSGSVSAELFVATPATIGDIDDHVLIGIRFGDASNVYSERATATNPNSAITATNPNSAVYEDQGLSECGLEFESESDITEITDPMPPQLLSVLGAAQVSKQALRPMQMMQSPLQPYPEAPVYDHVPHTPDAEVPREGEVVAESGQLAARYAARDSAASELACVQVPQMMAPSNSRHQNGQVGTDAKVVAVEIALSSLRDHAAEATTRRDSKQASLQRTRSEALKEMQAASEAAVVAAKAILVKQRELHSATIIQEQETQREVGAPVGQAQGASIDKFASPAHQEMPSRANLQAVQQTFRAPTASDFWQLSSSEQEQQRETAPPSQAQAPQRKCNRPGSARSVTSSYSHKSAMLPVVAEVDTPSDPSGSGGTHSEPSECSKHQQSQAI